jgi:hypothetical protein
MLSKSKNSLDKDLHFQMCTTSGHSKKNTFTELIVEDKIKWRRQLEHLNKIKSKWRKKIFSLLVESQFWRILNGIQMRLTHFLQTDFKRRLDFQIRFIHEKPLIVIINHPAPDLRGKKEYLTSCWGHETYNHKLKLDNLTFRKCKFKTRKNLSLKMSILKQNKRSILTRGFKLEFKLKPCREWPFLFFGKKKLWYFYFLHVCSCLRHLLIRSFLDVSDFLLFRPFSAFAVRVKPLQRMKNFTNKISNICWTVLQYYIGRFSCLMVSK